MRFSAMKARICWSILKKCDESMGAGEVPEGGEGGVKVYFTPVIAADCLPC